jgi:lysozyme family protein
MPSFEKAITLVLKHEGGFVNRPNDTGGATKYGLTLKDLSAFWQKPVSVSDAQALDIETAKKIYNNLFWSGKGFDKIASDAFAAVLFDQCVLGGMYAAITRLQTVLGLKADGLLGPQTLAAINSHDGKALGFKFIRASMHFYTRLAAYRSTQAEFLEGWIDRLFSLIDFLFFDEIT